MAATGVNADVWAVNGTDRVDLTAGRVEPLKAPTGASAAAGYQIADNGVVVGSVRANGGKPINCRPDGGVEGVVPGAPYDHAVTPVHQATLTITRGLPGSGKTTWAKQQRGKVRVNRDDLRRMLHDGRTGEGWAEVQVTVAQRAQVDALLRAGVDVICDDTNLRARVVRDLAEIAVRAGATVEIKDFFGVPVDECVARDAGRPETERVGEDVIRAMFQRYLAGRRQLPIPTLCTADAVAAGTPYVPPAGRPDAVLVDIDGTVAVMGERSPYDMTRVGEDRPHPPVIAAVRAMRAAGYRVVFCSGRSEDARAATEKWLATHLDVGYDALFMRAVGDQRKDSIVKAEIFEREIRHAYRILCVFDDRDQVVRMWRALGLTVFQVAEGDF